jgi:hypothetical protein
MKQKTISRTILAASVIATMLIPLAALADVPGRHPGYLHAIQDLKRARGLIARPDAPNVQADESRAVREIDACLSDLTQAAWIDGKINNPMIVPDAGLDFSGRLHKGLELLRKAHSDMDREEDDPAALGFRARANKHVDRAIGFTRRAIGEKFDDGFLR